MNTSTPPKTGNPADTPLPPDGFLERTAAGTPTDEDVAWAALQGDRAKNQRKRLVAERLEREAAAIRRTLDDGDQPSNTELTFYTPGQIAAISTADADWIIPGLLAREAITELDGKIKASGKTTFALDAIRSITTSESFLGYTTQRSKVVYLTEQQRGPFLAALRRAKLDRSEDLLILFRSDFNGMPWERIVELAVAQCEAFGAAMLVIDTIAKLAGIKEENNSGDWNEAMTPLQDAATANLALLVLRHSRKGGGDVGDTGRGSSAASGDVDIILELRRPEGNQPSTRRVLESLSRYDETPEKIIIDLTPDGYVLLGSDEAVSIATGREFVSVHLYSEFGRNELGTTEDELVAAAQNEDPPLSRSTIKRAVKDLLNRNQIRSTGAGVKGDPKRYQPLVNPEDADPGRNLIQFPTDSPGTPIRA